MGGPGAESKVSMANMFAALDKSKKKKKNKVCPGLKGVEYMKVGFGFRLGGT